MSNAERDYSLKEHIKTCGEATREKPTSRLVDTLKEMDALGCRLRKVNERFNLVSISLEGMKPECAEKEPNPPRPDGSLEQMVLMLELLNKEAAKLEQAASTFERTVG